MWSWWNLAWLYHWSWDEDFSHPCILFGPLVSHWHFLFSAAQQSWQRALTVCASFVFYCWYFSRSKCLYVSSELLHILRCVSVCKIELIKNTCSPTCVPAYCTFLFMLTEAGGVCSLTRIKQMLLCPSCWKWNGLCRLVPAVSLSLLFLASLHFNRILLVIFRKMLLSQRLVRCSPAELYCGWMSWMVRWIYWWLFKGGTNKTKWWSLRGL